jgi:hypothetical protein
LIEENCEWIFVNRIPLLCEKNRIEKQQKVETWLNLYQVTRELGIRKTKTHVPLAMNYVI